MTKETKQSKRDEITEAKKKFLGTSSLRQIHYGDTFFFEDIVLWGIRPMRLFADSIDNLLNENDDIEGSCLLLNELQQKLDDLIEHLGRWDKEERDFNVTRKRRLKSQKKGDGKIKEYDVKFPVTGFIEAESDEEVDRRLNDNLDIHVFTSEGNKAELNADLDSLQIKEAGEAQESLTNRKAPATETSPQDSAGA